MAHAGNKNPFYSIAYTLNNDPFFVVFTFLLTEQANYCTQKTTTAQIS